MRSKSDPTLEEFVTNALRRFYSNLEAALPRTAVRLHELMRGVPISAEHVFRARSFPHVLAPYWLSPIRNRVVDVEFQTDVIYSSISGYYSIRLCDNIADNDGSFDPRKLAPCTLFFDSEFMFPYLKYFPKNHQFWNLFRAFVAQQAEASAADSFLIDVNAKTFSEVCSRKFAATKIPISAVRFRYQELEDSFEQWLRFVDCLGNFAQFDNDFFDWKKDSQYCITTYVTSEWKRKLPRDTIVTWFLKEGFDWGVSELKMRFRNAIEMARLLGNDEILDWTIARGQVLDEDINRARSGLDLVRQFGRITIVE